MRMNCSIFWGIFLIILGISIIINILFCISLPIFKLFLAGLFFYIGLKILISPTYTSRCRTSFTCYSKNTDIDGDIDQERYDINFSSSTINLKSFNDLKLPKKNICFC